MRVRAIIQARMGSSRLRGKSLSSINGIPLLKRVIDTIISLELTDDIVVVTTTQIEDDPLEAYCKFLNIKCLRGDVNDVLSRFSDASIDLDMRDTLIRITADNIFYQKNICKELLTIHSHMGNDYTGIKGLSHIVCELIKVAAIRIVLNRQLNDYDKEHVTPYFINNPDMFKSTLCDPFEFGLEKSLDGLLTVDTAEDRDRIEQLITHFEMENRTFTKENLYNWLQL